MWPAPRNPHGLCLPFSAHPSLLQRLHLFPPAPGLSKKKGASRSLSQPCCPIFICSLGSLQLVLNSLKQSAPTPPHTHPMRPRFQSTSGSLEEEKGTAQAVSPNSHFCLPEQEDHQARFSLPARQPGNSLQAVDWGKCGPPLIHLSPLRDGLLVLSVSRSLKTIVAYTLSF